MTQWKYLRIGVALLLWVAATAKILNFIETLSGDGLLASKPILLSVIAFETGAGLYVLIGQPFWAWMLAICTFAIFAIASTYAIASGQSCNCISSSLGPKVMLPIDLMVLGLAAWMRPVAQARAEPLSGFRIAGCIVLGLVVGGVAAVRDQPVQHDAPLEFLLADVLIDRPWPLNSNFDESLRAIEAGRWMAIVVRHDCVHCRELLERHFAEPTFHRPGERTVVFVAGDDRWPFQLDHVSLEPNADGEIVWDAGEPFVASPAIFLIDNGIVTMAADGKDSEAFIDSLQS